MKHIRFAFSFFLPPVVAIATLLGPVVPAHGTVVNGCSTTGTTYPSVLNQAGFGGGLGTQPSPWMICSTAQLAAIATNSATLTGNYVLKSDLDLSGITNWVPIGPIFSGVFDGGYFQISNAVIRGNPNNGGSHPVQSPATATSKAGSDLYGLFTMVSGEIRNLSLRNFRVTSETEADETQDDTDGQTLYSYQDRFPMSGALVGGALDGSKFFRIQVINSQVSGKSSRAGLVAGACQTNCTFDLIDASSASNVVEVTSTIGSPHLGGIVGGSSTNSGLIRVSRAVFGGRVGNKNLNPLLQATIYTGGIIGNVTGTARIDQSQVTGTLQSSGPGSYVAGLIIRASSQISPASDYIIRNSVFSGTIDVANAEAASSIGGLVDLVSNSIQNSLMLGTMFTRTNTTNFGPVGGRDELILGQNPFAYTGGSAVQTFYNSDALSFFAPTELGTQKTESELKNILTYSDASWSIGLSGAAGTTTATWSVSDYNPTTQVMSGNSKVWAIEANSYPRLLWRELVPVSVPASVSASSAGAGVASVSWSASTGIVSGYRIESSVDNGANWVTQSENTGNSQTTATVSGLIPGQSYLFRVSALSSSFFPSAFSNPSVAVLMGSNPGAPQNLSALNLSPNSFRISWDPPSNTGGLSITSYTLQVDKGNGYQTVAHTGTSADIDGVSVNSAWSFRVLATNVVGSSAYAVFTNTPPVPYSGPIVTNLSREKVTEQTVTQITVLGERLSLTISASIDSLPVKILSKSDNQMIIELPALTLGIKDLKLVSTSGNLTHQEAFEVVAATPAPQGRVNVGSFNGKKVVYAAGLSGKRISWKVGGKWGSAIATSDFVRFDRPTPRRGVTVLVDVYVNGVKTLTKSVVTR